MPEYGIEKRAEATDRLEAQREEAITEAVDQAYMALAAGRLAEATDSAIRLFFYLRDSPGRYHARNVQAELLGTEYESEFRHMPVKRLLGGFSRAARDLGAIMDDDRARYPQRVIAQCDEDDEAQLGAATFRRIDSGISLTGEDVISRSLETLEAVAIAQEILPARISETHRLEKDLAESWIHQEYSRRVEIGQDMVTVVSAAGERGMGKSVLAMKLADQMDRNGGITEEQVTIHPQRLREKYLELPAGSALVLDEAEAGLSNREAMATANRAIRDLLNMGRVEEKYLIVVAPTADHIDKFAEQLSAAWILCEDLGEARLHEYKYNAYEEEVYTPARGRLQWWDINSDRLRECHDKITEQKRAKLRGEGGGEGTLVKQKDVDKRIDQAVEAAEQDTRDEIVRDVYEQADLTQSDLADALGLSRSRIAGILSE